MIRESAVAQEEDLIQYNWLGGQYEVGYTSTKNTKGRVGEQNPCSNSALVDSNEDTDN